MEFADSDEQALLRDSVRRFAAQRHPFHRGRKVAPRDGSWREVAANGWTAVGLTEEAGGIGLLPVELAIIQEEFGRGLVIEPFVSSILLGARAIELIGDASQRAAIADVISGDTVVALAHEEVVTRGAITQIATIAERAGKGWRINGDKICVYGAGLASQLLVTARTSGAVGDRAGISLFLVPRSTDGIEGDEYLTIDGFDAADLSLRDCFAPDNALIGREGGAAEAIEDVVDLAVVALSAEAVGSMERALHLTRDYALLRRQFGAPIGSFQAIRHRLADMVAELELGRSSLHRALAARSSDNRVEQNRAASGCKAFVGRAGRFVCENAIQIHGGVGMADELEVGHHYRRVLAIDAMFGNAEFHLERFASLTRICAAAPET
jgi:alkylation response protein AidB-like acyl-CoA dehydrogenase